MNNTVGSQTEETVATALFADVVGSTVLGERLDAEDVVDVVGGTVRAVVFAVERWGGVVREIAGDGVLALFPRRSDDAMAAAGEILCAVGEVAARVAEVHGVGGLGVRVGVHTGTVRRAVAGAVDRVAGDAIAGAVDLESRALPGTALVSTSALTHAESPPLTAASDIDGVGGAAWVLGPTSGAAMPAPTRDGDAVLPKWLREQRKVVTAVFVKLVSEDEATGADADLAIVDVLERMAANVDRFGGRVKDYAGNGLVALFGAPFAHEDDADRALLAALAMRSTAETAAHAMSTAIGVTTGSVVVGPVGGGRAVEYGATGDAMNTAARIQGAARPSEILVGAPTRERLRSHYRWGAGRSIQAKGKSRPLVVSPLEDAAVDEVATEALPEVMVGRDDQLRIVSTAVADLVAGVGQVVLVEGEAGMGKSSLVAALLAQLPDDVVLIHQTCSSWNAERRLFAAARVARSALVRAGMEVPAEVDLLLGTDERWMTADTTQERLSAVVRDRFAAAVARISARHAVAIVVEDLHWADGASLQVLGEPHSGAALVVLSSRPNSGAVRAVVRAANVVNLAPLPRAEADALLGSLVGRATLPYALEHAILTTAAGNPFFLRELARGLVEAGLLVRESDRSWRYDGPEDLTAIPDSIERTVLARIDRLDSEEREVLEAAAILGIEFEEQTLTGLVGHAVGPVLRELVERGLLRTTPTLGFAHALIHESVSRSLLRRRRRALHRRAAEVSSGAPASVLAHHWWEGAEPSRAFVPALVAADQALLRYSYDEAIRLFELAVACRGGAEDHPAVDLALLLRLAATQHAGGRHDVARATFASAGDLASLVGDPHALAVAAVGYEDALFASRERRGGADDRSMDLLDRARHHLVHVADRRMAGHVEAARARALAYLGDRSGSLDAIEGALTIARSAGDAQAETAALISWRAAHQGPEWLHDRLGRAAELRDAAARVGDLAVELEAGRLVLMDQLGVGDIAAADQSIEELSASIIRLARPQHLWYPPMWQAMRLLMQGRLDEADGATAEFFQVARRVRYPNADLVHALQLLLLRRAQGRVEELTPHFDELLARHGVRVLPSWTAIAVARGDHAAVRATLDRYRRAPDELLPPDLSFAAAAVFLAEAAVVVGDRKAARILYRQLLPWDDQLVVVGAGAACFGPCAGWLARLARLLGNDNAAAAHETTADALALQAGMCTRLSTHERRTIS